MARIIVKLLADIKLCNQGNGNALVAIILGIYACIHTFLISLACESFKIKKIEGIGKLWV